MKEIIYKKNTGISKLNSIYNKVFEYFAEEKVYLENEQVIVEEHKKIDIITNILNKAELDAFINDIKKTDIIDIFDYIEIRVDFKDFIHASDPNSSTMRHGVEFYDENKKWVREEYFSVFLYR